MRKKNKEKPSFMKRIGLYLLFVLLLAGCVKPEFTQDSFPLQSVGKHGRMERVFADPWVVQLENASVKEGRLEASFLVVGTADENYTIEALENLFSARQGSRSLDLSFEIFTTSYVSKPNPETIPFGDPIVVKASSSPVTKEPIDIRLADNPTYTLDSKGEPAELLWKLSDEDRTRGAGVGRVKFVLDHGVIYQNTLHIPMLAYGGTAEGGSPLKDLDIRLVTANGEFPALDDKKLNFEGTITVVSGFILAGQKDNFPGFEIAGGGDDKWFGEFDLTFPALQKGESGTLEIKEKEGEKVLKIPFSVTDMDEAYWTFLPVEYSLEKIK